MPDYLVRLTPGEAEQIKARAETEGRSIAGTIRAALGLPQLERGGAREGAGRKPAKKARKKK